MSDLPRESSPFELRAAFRDPFRQRLFDLMRGSLERFLQLDQLDRLYRATVSAAGREDFLEAAMRAVGVRAELLEDDRRRIPAEGPAMVVANHPLGGVDALVLLVLFRRIRPDVKLLSNYLLQRIPEMHQYAIFVDPYGGSEAARANLRPMKECVRWLRDGHVLIVFPSGDVSRLKLLEARVTDPPWNATVATMIRMARCPVLPVFVEGRNSAWFQALGLLHPRVRTAMLPREFIRKRGHTIGVRVGSLIPFARLEPLADDDLVAYLRLRTYVLRGRSETRGGAAPPPTPVAPPLHPETIAQDVMLLPPDACLLEADKLAVYCAPADRIPNLLHEIGRLREITFRAAGEGTGRDIDLDRFDAHYLHLFLWNRATRELIGAYRIGPTDLILPRFGKKGLYTSTLFRYSRRLLDTMGPALELGRSFVRPEYQRTYSPLLLLWKGIGRFILREPRYRHLFGPVSINNEYNSLSRQMMVQFLRANRLDTRWARHVRPRHPPRVLPLRERWNPELFRRVVRDTDDIAELIADIERDQKGIPVLLKQYLKLGGRLLGFNVDPNFSDVLDGLIWVDLLEVDPKILVRFLGETDAARFLAFHGRRLPESTPSA
ncbi:MAG: lysophospholipid acyltransferase family protein [Kiritimatiellae bacterium]|nr:lysophospholipid acyltransferase family protein [Kiritimatiellia bacterium]